MTVARERFTDDPYADREALASLLEQAERERDEARQEIEHPFDRSEFAAMQARLVKADALAEVLRHCCNCDCFNEALAAYEQERKP